MHDIKLMVEKEIMKAMLTVHTLRWREKDTPPNIGICVIVLFAAWTKRTQGLGEAPTTVKRYRSLPVEFHVHILMTRVLTKASVLWMTSGQLEKKIGPLVIQHTFHISTFYISPLPKDGVARYFGCILYSLEILYVWSENHFDMLSYRFLLNVELSKLVDMLSRHFKDRFVKWPPGKPR
jgi:hypothetical protein